MMGIGEYVMEVAKPVLEFIAPMVPGEIFPYFFTMEMFQRALVAAVLVTLVAGVLGSFLLVRNLALIGDGLAHVSFGGVAVGVVLGASSPLWYALVFSIVSAILIHELQTRELLTGDASIAIFLTGMLALGLVVLRVFGGGITSDIEGYLFGSLLLIDEESLDLIATISIVSLISLMLLYSGLLSTTIDPLAARVQGLPVRAIGLVFSIITAAVVVSMVQVIGALLVTALLVTPAATGGLIGRSFRSCLIWAQIFGLSSVFLGLYLSAEYDSGSGAMIALVAASIFAAVAIMQIVWKTIIRPSDNWN
ncbi:metal ABC transporter permease [Candidatus Poseidoniales archaeon]|nr:metal ABC transporter permease [Candidatus Poseidoniales archaeon]